MFDYYITIQEGLNSLFIQSKVASGKFKIDGSSTTTNALSIASDIVPACDTLIARLGEAIESRNEDEIRNKLNKISQLVPDHARNDISRNIACKLTICRRKFLTELTIHDVK